MDQAYAQRDEWKTYGLVLYVMCHRSIPSKIVRYSTAFVSDGQMQHHREAFFLSHPLLESLFMWKGAQIKQPRLIGTTMRQERRGSVMVSCAADPRPPMGLISTELAGEFGTSWNDGAVQAHADEETTNASRLSLLIKQGWSAAL